MSSVLSVTILTLYQNYVKLHASKNCHLQPSIHTTTKNITYRVVRRSLCSCTSFSCGSYFFCSIAVTHTHNAVECYACKIWNAVNSMKNLSLNKRSPNNIAHIMNNCNCTANISVFGGFFFFQLHIAQNARTRQPQLKLSVVVCANANDRFSAAIRSRDDIFVNAKSPKLTTFHCVRFIHFIHVLQSLIATRAIIPPSYSRRILFVNCVWVCVWVLKRDFCLH